MIRYFWCLFRAYPDVDKSRGWLSTVSLKFLSVTQAVWGTGSYHVIGRFSDLLIWFVGNKIKKPMILCARNTSRSRNTDHAARTCEWFVYSIVKITRFYDYQTDAFVWEIREMRKGLWAFFLTMIFECWLAEQVNSDHMVWRMFKATVIMPPRLVCWLILWTTVNLIRCLRRPQKKKMKNA